MKTLIALDGCQGGDDGMSAKSPENLSLGFRPDLNTNRTVQPQKYIGLEVWIKENAARLIRTSADIRFSPDVAHLVGVILCTNYEFHKEICACNYNH